MDCPFDLMSIPHGVYRVCVSGGPWSSKYGRPQGIDKYVGIGSKVTNKNRRSKTPATNVHLDGTERCVLNKI